MANPEYETINMQYAYCDPEKKINSKSHAEIKYGSNVVAKKMSIDFKNWMFPPGSAPSASALEDIMIGLKNNYSGESFIKGHLLNSNLGGLGECYNMFPITSSANANHSNKIESKIKSFKNECNIQSGKYVVEIKNGDGSTLKDPLSTLNHNFIINCDYNITGASNAKPNILKTIQNTESIPSIPKVENIFYDIVDISHNFAAGNSKKSKNKTILSKEQFKDLQMDVEENISDKKFVIIADLMNVFSKDLGNFKKHVNDLDKSDKDNLCNSIEILYTATCTLGNTASRKRKRVIIPSKVTK